MIVNVVLLLGSNNPQLEYQINDITLMGNPTENDLGIVIDSNLKFHEHTAKAVNVKALLR